MDPRERAMQRMRDQQKTAPPAGRHSAATSHVRNDQYMDEFDAAYIHMQSMSLKSAPDIYAQLGAPTSDRPMSPGTPSVNSRITSGSSRAGNVTATAGRGGSSSSSSPSAARLRTPMAGNPPIGGGGVTSSTGRGGAGLGAGSSGPPRYPARVVPGWRSGPTDSQGTVIDVSDRPNSCSAANWSKGEVVIGSTDHALYVIDVVKGTKKRTLYTKACGHSEWVTCVTYMPDGRIVSGGMDSKMWLWPAGGTRGMQMEGHGGPISQVAYDHASDCVVSCSYDKTVRLWQCGSRAHEVACWMGHDAPVLEMDIASDGRVITGDRSGHIILWDASEAAAGWRMKNVHQGHITSLAWFDESDPNCAGLFVSGGQDGCVRVWDPRARTNVVKLQLHVNSEGRGAVSDMCAGGPAAANMLVTAGADGTLQVLDPRLSFAVAASVPLSDFPYSLAVAGGFALVGLGNGELHVVDIAGGGDTLYGLGANAAAVRCLEASEKQLVCSGDDGNVMLYTF